MPYFRSRRQLVLLAFALFLCLCFISWFGLTGELEVSIGAQPVTIRFPQSLPSPDQLTVTYRTPVDDPDGDRQQFGFAIPAEELMFPDPGRTTWRATGHWIKTIHITAPERILDAIAKVEIQVGPEAKTYTNLSTWKRLDQPLTGLLPNRSEPAVTIELPTLPDGLPAINSAPLETLIQRLAAFPIIGLAIAVLTAYLLMRFMRCWNTLAAEDSADGAATAGSAQPADARRELAVARSLGSRPLRWWFLAGLALSATGLGILYSRYSYPFTQDDNFSQFLPMVLYNCHAVLAGHWPAWNPHQFLGAPVATMGIYSVTYPPVYLAYGLARLAGNEYWTIEIYTLLHLAAGYTLFYLFLKALKIRPSLAALASASFVLSGWFLTAGRSQMTFAPLAVWPVAMAWSIHHLATTKRATWTWTLLTALSIGLFFHAGHSQMWVYAMLFYAAALAIHRIAGTLTWRQLAQALPALIAGVGIALPLLILQAIEGTSSTRGGAYGDRIEILHMLLPLGTLLQRPAGLGSTGVDYFCEMYYSGTLFQALSFLALALAVARFALTKEKGFRTWLAGNVWLALFALAILFGLGSKGILWTLFAQFPIFDRFRWPIKFAYFCLLYSTLAGAVLAERWFTRKPKFHYPVIAAVAGLLLFHVHLSRTSWYDFADRPYPELPAIMKQTTNSGGRLLTRWGSMDRSPLAGFYNTLPLDFATHAGAYAVGGYDTFVEGSLPARRVRSQFWQDPVAAARSYGVRWVAAEPMLDNPIPSPNQMFASLDAPSVGNILAIHATQDAAKRLGKQDGITLYELDNSDPFAFLTGDPRRALPIKMSPEGIEIDTATAQPGDTLICNFVMRNWLKTKAPVTLEQDDWGRIKIHIAQTLPTLKITYSPPWSQTLLAGCLLCLLGLAAHLGLRKTNQAQADQP